MLSLYNSLSRQEEPLPDQHKLRLFVCGPTVYDYLHIGNARTYIFFDFFAKLLRARDYEVYYLQNVTDIDDKIIAKAITEGKETKAVAERFTQAYFEDMKALGVDAVTTYAPATDFIAQIVAQVERLIDKDFAYKIDGDGWYFDISKDPDYGKLSGRTAAQAEDGVTRIDESVHKRNKGDFCLWKFTQTSLENLEPRWPSSLGSGRPGWHIEDTAISEFYFGPQYDIHGGGVDLKFPHHEAEIAQQESASGLKPFVRLWMHGGSLTVDGKKMSKSAGNFVTIRDFLEVHSAVVLRWIVLNHHYRSPIDYSERIAAQAVTELEMLYGLALQAREAAMRQNGPDNASREAAGKTWKEHIDAALDDDLNTPKALALTLAMLKDKELDAAAKYALITEMDAFLGLAIEETVREAGAIPPEIAQKFMEYQDFRSNKQFIQSDALRAALEGLGYVIRDSQEGSFIAKRFTH